MTQYCQLDDFVFNYCAHLLQARGVVLHFIWKKDEHAELLPFVGHLQNLRS